MPPPCRALLRRRGEGDRAASLTPCPPKPRPQFRSPRSAGAAPDGGVHARGLRAHRAGHDPAGRPVPRRGGRSLRARTYVFTDPDGAELCLRPDLTVPTCRLHLERHAAATCRRATATAARRSAISRAAPTARTRASSARPASSRSPRPTASRTTPPCCALIVAALRDAGLKHVQLRIGDLGLFKALIDALAMPERWRRRLKHQFWRPEAFRAELDAPDVGRGRRREACRGADRRSIPPIRQAPEALVADYLDPRPRADPGAHGRRNRPAPDRRGRRRTREAAARRHRPADRSLRRGEGAGPRRRRQAGRAAAPPHTASTSPPGSTPSPAASTCSAGRRRGFGPYAPLAGECLRPLGHVSRSGLCQPNLESYQRGGG